MKNCRFDNGISLIALIITIIVLIILAVIIFSNGSSETINKAQEATFRNDIKTIQEQLGIYFATKYSLDTSYNVRTQFGNISTYLPSVTKYDGEMEVYGGLLAYKGIDEIKKQIAREMGVIVDVVELNGTSYNKPDITLLPEDTTYAVYYDGSNNPQTMQLSQAKNDTSWYDYNSTVKKWANIKTTNNGNDAYWVWIPRYAYKIDNPHTVVAETIHIKFLAGTSNVPADKTELPGDYIVHPAFTFGGEELTGIWVAKFEASSNTPNAVDTEGYYTGGGDTTTLQVRVLPNVYSWRNITTGNAQTVSMNMTNSSGSIGTTENVDTHQIKNSEWGAIAYLSQSIYGKNSEVWINPYGDGITYKMKTGYAGANVSSLKLEEGNLNLTQYNIGNGLQASTTGNVYGVYDMSGGAYEYVAAFIENGNSMLGTCGSSTYFTNNKLKIGFEKYYDIYEPGDQEKQGGQYYGSGINTLNNGDNSNNTLRKTLTDETYAKMASRKGDGLYEISNGVSFRGKNSNGDYIWFINATDTATNVVRGWNNDMQLYGHGSLPWFRRGGGYYDYSYAGTFTVAASFGGIYYEHGFRPVLVTGASL